MAAPADTGPRQEVTVPYVVQSVITPLPGEIESVISAFRAVIPDVHREGGCEIYALHRRKDRLLMIEQWSHRDALAAHAQGPALARLNEMVEPMLTGPPDVTVFKPVPAGDAGRGQLRGPAL